MLNNMQKEIRKEKNRIRYTFKGYAFKLKMKVCQNGPSFYNLLKEGAILTYSHYTRYRKCNH